MIFYPGIPLTEELTKETGEEISKKVYILLNDYQIDYISSINFF